MMRRTLATLGSPFLAARWPIVGLALLLVFNAAATPGFYALELRDGRLFGVLVDILNHGSRVAIVALGMTLVIATGGVDLSVGAVAAISGAIAAIMVAHGHGSWYTAIAAALAVSGLAGLWNGVLVASLRLQPIVATLILMVAGRGIAQLLTDGLIITFEDPALAFLGNGAIGGLPISVWTMIGVLGACTLVTRRTSVGLFIEAVGDNEAAARLSGVSVRAVKVCVYTFCGVCAGIFGIIECSYIKAADSNNAGQLLELDAILAVVIGGTSLNGGRFRLLGTVIGALAMQTLTKTMYMLDVSAEIVPAPKAVAVLLICLLQSERISRYLGGLTERGRA